MDDQQRQLLYDWVATGESEMLHIVDGKIRVRPEWRAARAEEHMREARKGDWCDCELHDPRP